jgi:hypothetical protein
MPNIYKKLNQLREEIQKANLRKTGKNPFAKFEYFELADFMPTVLVLENKLGLFSKFDVENSVGTLTVFDVDSEESVKFSLPFKQSTNISDEAQSVGAGITYTRRYLYVNLLELVESDSLDATVGNKEVQPQLERLPVNIQRRTTSQTVTQTKQASPNFQTKEVANLPGNFPKLGDIAIIEGHECIVRKNKTNSELFWASTNPDVKFFKHIGPEQ